MDMVILALALNQNCLKVLADFCKQLTQRFMGGIRQHITTIFGYEDQMHMQSKNTISSCPKCS